MNYCDIACELAGDVRVDGVHFSHTLATCETLQITYQFSKDSSDHHIRRWLLWKDKCIHESRELTVIKTILVVEDSRFLRVMIERSLVRTGYKVVTARDGDEAVRMAAETVPDLVLLDMLLPKLSGPEVLRSLRTIPQTEAVPIVVLSSLPQSNEDKLKRDGATAYFDKSRLALHEHSESLIEIVKQMLDDPAGDSSGNDLPDSNLRVAAKGKV